MNTCAVFPRPADPLRDTPPPPYTPIYADYSLCTSTIQGRQIGKGVRSSGNQYLSRTQNGGTRGQGAGEIRGCSTDLRSATPSIFSATQEPEDRLAASPSWSMPKDSLAARLAPGGQDASAGSEACAPDSQAFPPSKGQSTLARQRESMEHSTVGEARVRPCARRRILIDPAASHAVAAQT